MTPRLRYAIVALFVIAAVPGWAGLFWVQHNEHAQQVAQQHQTELQRAAQRREGLAVERKLCTDLGTMAALRPPSGSAPANPSRAYEQAEHRAWTGLYLGIGCKETTP